MESKRKKIHLKVWWISKQQHKCFHQRGGGQRGSEDRALTVILCFVNTGAMREGEKERENTRRSTQF